MKQKKPKFINMMSFHKNPQDFYHSQTDDRKPYYDFTVCFPMLNEKTNKYQQMSTSFKAECVDSALVRLVTNDFDLKNKVDLVRNAKNDTVILAPSHDDIAPPPPPMPHPDDIT